MHLLFQIWGFPFGRHWFLHPYCLSPSFVHLLVLLMKVLRVTIIILHYKLLLSASLFRKVPSLHLYSIMMQSCRN